MSKDEPKDLDLEIDVIDLKGWREDAPADTLPLPAANEATGQTAPTGAGTAPTPEAPGGFVSEFSDMDGSILFKKGGQDLMTVWWRDREQFQQKIDGLVKQNADLREKHGRLDEQLVAAKRESQTSWICSIFGGAFLGTGLSMIVGGMHEDAAVASLIGGFAFVVVGRMRFR